MRKNDINKGFISYRTRKNMNFNSLGNKPYQENYNKLYEKNENSYDNY